MQVSGKILKKLLDFIKWNKSCCIKTCVRPPNVTTNDWMHYSYVVMYRGCLKNPMAV